MEILRDSVWQFVGAALSLLAVVIAILIFRAQKSRRELGFGVLSMRPVITVDSEVSRRIQITLDGHPVENVHLAVFAIKNTGNTPFQEQDFSRPTRISFGQASRILDAQITRQFPDNLNATSTYDEEAIVIPPFLMNPGEFLVVQALISGLSPEATCDLRAQGISSLRPLARRTASSTDSTNSPAFLLSAVAFFALMMVTDIAYRVTKSVESAGLPFLGASIIVAVSTVALTFAVGYFMYRLSQRLSARQTRYIDDA